MNTQIDTAVELQSPVRQTSVDAVLEELRQMHVNTEWDVQLRRHLDRLLQVKADGELSARPALFAHGRETRGILVTHAPGGCKTTLVSHMLRTHPAFTNRQHYVEATVPSPAKLGALLRTILSNSGYNIVTQKDEPLSLTEQLKRRFGAQQTGVLWIDEAQDLKSVGKDSMLRTIKSFMQAPFPVVVILSGTPDLLKIIESDEQLDRRFSKLKLPMLDPYDYADRILPIIGSYASAAGLELEIADDLPQRLIHGSRNLFGRCIENIIGAIEMALRSGDTSLTDFHFADYYELQEGCSPESNVYLNEYWADIRFGVHDEEGAAPRKAHRWR
ncbi:AAA family ATPase [Falsigemmobacter intermedius]|uniref:ATP-binding protein n=1 Tax=Falsigemmobacter intermedius TaxID=1553448 RepID=A0A444MAB6_9RHOB|nr:ATP-binding protein [Falsigemmobacter intermedius]RWY40106.1 ATP-binding protein [Falsigemmobacter intermedius]